MSWLRVDDGFTSNPKIRALSDREFRVWMRTLCQCARARDPRVDEHTMREVPGLTKRSVRTFTAAGLLEEEDGVVVVHDWSTYNPKDATAAERQARRRARLAVVHEPGCSHVLDEALPCTCGADVGEEPERDIVTPAGVTVTGPHARARAGSRPVPSRPLSTALAAVEEGGDGGRRDLLFEAVVSACGLDVAHLTRSARGSVNRCLKELREVDASPGEISSRAATYRRRFHGAALTPAALVKHWPSLTPPRAPEVNSGAAKVQRALEGRARGDTAA